mgnify:CR=1 FL=1
MRDGKGRETERERERDRQTERERESDIEREREREIAHTFCETSFLIRSSRAFIWGVPFQKLELTILCLKEKVANI